MSASVANSLASKLSAPSAVQAPKGAEGSPKSGESFTKHLDEATDAAEIARRQAAGAKPKSADRKASRAGAGSVKKAKTAEGDAAPKDANPQNADEAAAATPSDLSAEVAAKALPESVGDKPLKEPKPIVPDKAGTAQANAAVSLAVTAPLEVKAVPGAVAKAGGVSAVAPVQTVVDNVASQPPTENPDPAAPTADANAKAQETATAFEAKLAKNGAGKAVAHVSPLDEVPAAVGAGVSAKPQAASANAAVATDGTAALASAAPLPQASVPSDKPAPTITSDTSQAVAGGAAQTQPHVTGTASTPAAQAPAPAPEARFAETNHANIVTGVQTNLMPHGGTMQIRLDPPELGALRITIEMRDGSMSATFQTSNDDATRMLSHSLGQLKTALESQGVNVEKIQVRQAPKDQPSQNHEGSSQQQLRDEANARQEEQRRELLQKMWRKVAGGEPMDLVA